MVHPFRALVFIFLSSLFCSETSAQYSVTAEGRDFYIGYKAPSYLRVADPATAAFSGAFALVSSYTENHIQVSYFDRTTGAEIPSSRYAILARAGITIPLNLAAMAVNDTSENLEYAACHITADRPINIEFFSTGACAGGSYLALSTPALGKKYVIASYNDNPGNGGLLGGANGAKSLDSSRGFFEIIAAFDTTFVTIIPNATTAGDRSGVHTGAHNSFPNEIPFGKVMNRGQCLVVKSGGSDTTIDMSGSIVQSDKPIAVIAGHENAFIGGLSGRGMEGRDYMVEQMIPVGQWDSTGYISLPLADSQPADPGSFQGVGENYRVYDFDSVVVSLSVTDACTGPSTMSATRLAYPTPERQGITCPIDFSSTNGKKFGLMMYDQRNFASTAPYPAPSMMTIIPMSHWRTSYLWLVPTNKFETLQSYYVNIIGPTADFDAGMQGILASYNTGTVKPVKTALSLTRQWKPLPNHPGYAGMQFKLAPGSYYATGPHPFMVYNFGFRGIDPEFDLGDFDGDDFFFSYAAPAGAAFGGDRTHFRAKIDTMCASWNVCIHDSTFGIPNHGIRSVSLLIDPTQDIIHTAPSTAKAGYNVTLEDQSGKPTVGEINLSGVDSDFCFRIAVDRPFDSAYAPVFVSDDAGNGAIFDLYYHSPEVTLSADSADFRRAALAHDTCISFKLKNHAVVGGAIFNVASASLTHADNHFTISGIVPALPASLKPGDSLIITACFQPSDSSLRRDTIKLITDCFDQQLALVGKAAIPIIVAGNRDFGNVLVDSTKCDTVSIRNIGDADFTLTRNWLLSNTTNFTLKDSQLFPIIVKPGQVIYLTICYTPYSEELDTGVLYWGTSLTDPYKHSVKDYSILRGGGAKVGFVWDWNFRQFVVDTTTGIDSVVERVLLYNNSYGSGGVVVQVDSVILRGADAGEFYILDNQLGITPMDNFSLPPSDSIFVDIVFKPNLNKPKPARYADRHAELAAINGNLEKDQVVTLLGSIAGFSGVEEKGDPSGFTVLPNPATGEFAMVSIPESISEGGILHIHDVLGRLVYTRTLSAGMSNFLIPLRTLAAGVYYVTFASGKDVYKAKLEVVK